QAEDGIRDFHVTGVQTCALPIYAHKYGIRDYRGGGRASARETAMRVAAGAVAQLYLAQLGIQFRAGVVQIGSFNTAPEHPQFNWQHVYDDPLYCRSEEHTSELQSRENLVCRLLL